MIRAAVFGASGFIGGALLATNEPLASHIILIDPVEPHPDILQQARHRCKHVDVRQAQSLRENGDPGDVDVLIVLAGKTDVDQALADPAMALTTNLAIAVEVGEWWRLHQATRVVYLSSDEVLGVSNWPLAEDAPYKPTQPYAASKAAAEMTLRCYSDTYGLNLIIIRSCNLVGGQQRARKLVPTAVQYLANRQAAPVFGSGMQVREYLAVEDLCNVVRMATAGVLSPGIYNCTSAVNFTVLEVVDIIAAALGVRASRVHVADRLVQDQAYAMDPSLLQSLGWKAHIPPAEAITKAALDLHAAWQRGEDLTIPGRQRG